MQHISGNRFVLRAIHLLIGMMLPAAVLIIWQMASSNGWVNAVLVPPPKDILTEFGRMISSGELLTNLRISTGRAALGFLIGGGLGLAAGIWVGFSINAERLLDPSLQLLRTLPHLAVAPLFILWFGFGETSKILLIAKGLFSFIR